MKIRMIEGHYPHAQARIRRITHPRIKTPEQMDVSFQGKVIMRREACENVNNSAIPDATSVLFFALADPCSEIDEYSPDEISLTKNPLTGRFDNRRFHLYLPYGVTRTLISEAKTIDDSITEVLLCLQNKNAASK